MNAAGLAGWAVVDLGEGADRLDLPLGVHLAAKSALEHAGLSREDVSGVVLASSDALDGRLISSMHLAGPSGAYLKDKTKIVDDPTVALAAAVWRIACGTDRAVIVATWHSPAESDPQNAVSGDPEPFFSRPIGAHPAAMEALAVNRWLSDAGVEAARFDDLTSFLAPSPIDSDVLFAPLRADHFAPVQGTAVAVVVAADGARAAIGATEFSMDSGTPLERDPDQVRRLCGRIRTRTGVDPMRVDVVETTDRTVFRLLMAADALGFGAPEAVADALVGVGIPRLQPSGGLFRRNAGYAAGLERVVAAADAIERGATSAVAHASYGRAGQGQSLTLLGAVR